MLIEYRIKLKLQNYLEKKNLKLFDWFFEKNPDFGILSKNIYVEVNQKKYLDGESKHRVDMLICLPNNCKIIIEINEKNHEKEGLRYQDLNRARKICDNDKNIKKFLIIREKFFNKKHHITSLVKKKIYPLLQEISLLHDEKAFIIKKLIQLTHEDWKPICELMYDSHKYKKKYIIDIIQLNDFHDFHWTNKFIECIEGMCKSESISEQLDIDSDIDDLLSDCEDDIDKIDNNIKIKKNNINDFYKKNDDSIKLTWKGFNAYYQFIFRFIDLGKKVNSIFDFKYKIFTKFIDLLKEHRNRLLKLTNTSCIWGYYDNDYKNIIN